MLVTTDRFKLMIEAVYQLLLHRLNVLGERVNSDNVKKAKRDVYIIMNHEIGDELSSCTYSEVCLVKGWLQCDGGRYEKQ